MPDETTHSPRRLWAGKRDGVALALFGVALAVGAAVYFYGWPEARWRWVDRPRLLKTLEEAGGPALEVLRVTDPIAFEHHATLDGVRIGSPVPLSVSDGRVLGEGFKMTVHEDYPQIPPAEYFGMSIGPLAVTAEDVHAADTRLKRGLAAEAVDNRAFLASTRFDRAVLVDGADGDIVYFSNAQVITGVVLAADESARRNFVVTLDGFDRDVAERMVQQLQWVGEP